MWLESFLGNLFRRSTHNYSSSGGDGDLAFRLSLLVLGSRCCKSCFVRACGGKAPFLYPMSQGPTPHTRCFRPSFPPGSPDANRWTPFFDAIDARNASTAPPELERAGRLVQMDPDAAPFTPKRVSFTPDSQGTATAALHFDAAVVQASSFTPKNATVSHNTPGTAAQNLLLVHPVPSDVRLHNELAILPALRALDIRGQTIYLQPSRSDLALDNGVRNTRDPRQTWHTFFSALRMAGAFAPLLGAGWRYKIRPELAWMKEIFSPSWPPAQVGV